jgi:hypothetical protein
VTSRRSARSNLEQSKALPGPQVRPRLQYLDNLRWLMIILVISMHTGDSQIPLVVGPM